VACPGMSDWKGLSQRSSLYERPSPSNPLIANAESVGYL
jgi:hypothetical protein